VGPGHPEPGRGGRDGGEAAGGLTARKSRSGVPTLAGPCGL
jgi:hypothetical protein